jgi:hypothetical protein
MKLRIAECELRNAECGMTTVEKQMSRGEVGQSMKKSHAAILVLCCLAALACAREEASSQEPAAVAPDRPAPGAPREIAVAIDASKPGLRAESRTGTAGGMAAGETRYYVGSTLVLVEEVVGTLDAGGSQTAFYFDDERLVFFRGRGTRTFFVPGGAETKERFDIEIGYDHDGNVVESSKTVDGAPAALEPLDWEAPKVRAGMLLDDAR